MSQMSTITITHVSGVLYWITVRCVSLIFKVIYLCTRDMPCLYLYWMIFSYHHLKHSLPPGSKQHGDVKCSSLRQDRV